MSCALTWAAVLQPSVIGAGAWWLVLVVCLVVGIGTVVSIRRQRRRVDRLLADLSVRTR